MKQPRRFGELRQLIPEITNTTLASSLREREEDGLIRRRQYEGSHHGYEYTFGGKGLDLLPVFFEMTAGD